LDLGLNFELSVLFFFSLLFALCAVLFGFRIEF